jgi:hypothetical protein
VDFSNPQDVLAETRGGIYRSHDAGRTWSPSGQGLWSAVRCLARSPQNPGLVWAGTEWGGVFVSADGGSSWLPRNTGLHYYWPGVHPIDALAVDAGHQGKVYALIRGNLWTMDPAHAKWTMVHESPWDNTARVLACDPKRTGTIYLGANGLLRSIDGGITFQQVASAGTEPINAIACDGGSTPTIYAGGGRLVVSRDGGDTFTVIEGGLGAGLLPVQSLVVDPWTAGAVWARDARRALWRSLDFGTSWESWSPFWTGSALAVVPGPSGGFLAGGGYGLLRRDAGSDTWEPSWAGLRAWRFTSVVTCPRHPGYALAVLDLPHPSEPTNLMATTDGGENWSAVNIGDLWEVDTVTVDSACSVYAVTGTQIIRSDDMTATWQVVSESPTSFASPVLTVAPSDPSTIYLRAGVRSGMWKSLDRGRTWSNLIGTDTVDVLDVAVDARDPNMVVIGTWGLWRSVDGGGTWEELGDAGYPHQETPVSPSPPAHTWAVAIDPASSATLMGITIEGGLHRSTDGGEHWSQTATSYRNGSVVLFDPVVPGRVLMGSQAGGIFISFDSGATWQPMNDGLGGDPAVQSLAFDSRGGRAYAVTAGGLFVADLPVPSRPARRHLTAAPR